MISPSPLNLKSLVIDNVPTTTYGNLQVWYNDENYASNSECFDHVQHRIRTEQREEKWREELTWAKWICQLLNADYQVSLKAWREISSYEREEWSPVSRGRLGAVVSPGRSPPNAARFESRKGCNCLTR